MKTYFTITFLFLFSLNIFSQFDSPKREMRGVWIATVANIDWPAVKGINSTAIKNQKDQLINIFNSHKIFGLNTIFFQVRTTCDALYKSNFDIIFFYEIATVPKS